MQRRICSVLLSALLLGYSFALPAFAAMENFKTQRLYADRFTDVSANAWYQPSVAEVYELGLMNGKSTYQFRPDGQITVAETVALAARVHATYSGGKIYLTEGAWYAPYAHYAQQNGIIDTANLSAADWNAPITRARFVQILYAALPAAEYPAVNPVVSIPDVAASDAYGPAVYAFYAAGILQGNDAQGRFSPAARLNRAQGAAILARMVDAKLRLQSASGSGAAASGSGQP